MTSRSRNFIVVQNAATRILETSLALEQHADIKFAAWQTEEKNHKHLQAMCVFKTLKTLKQVKAIFPGAHIEVMGGSPLQAWEYSTKEDTRVGGPNGTRGPKPKGPGARSDLGNLRASIDAGDTLVEIWDDNWSAMVRYGNGAREYMSIKAKVRGPDTKMPRIMTFWGPTGTGKSHKARELAMKIDPDFAVWCVEKGRKMWAVNTPNGESPRVLLLDDFEGEIDYRMMLRLCDKYKCVMPKKYGEMHIVVEYIFITSNTEPSTWYKADFAPLKRRLEFGDNEIKHMTEVYVEPVDEPMGPPAPVPPPTLPSVLATPLGDGEYRHDGMGHWRQDYGPVGGWSSAQPWTTEELRQQLDPFYNDYKGPGGEGAVIFVPSDDEESYNI